MTCSSRLRVTDPNLVGTIAACPKCGSLVEIHPPQPPSTEGQLPLPPQEKLEVGSEIIDSETITRDAIAMEDLAPPVENASPAAPFLGGESVAPASHRVRNVPLSPEDWQSDRTRKSRQVGMIVAVSAMTMLFVVVVIAWFIRSRSGVANVSTDEKTSEPTTELVEPVAPPETPTETEALTETNDTDRLSEQASPPSEDSIANATKGSDEQVAPIEKPISDAPEMIPADLIPKDPLADSLLNSDDKRDPTSSDPPVNPMQELPIELAKLVQILDFPSQSNEVMPSIAPPPSLDKQNLEAAAEESLDPMMIATPPPAIDMKRSLAFQFALDSKGYPLADLMLLYSQVTGVPIQLDWMSLDLLQIDVAVAVVPPRGMLSAREHLSKVAESIGGIVKFEENHVLMTIDERTFTKVAESIVTFEDFGADRGAAITRINRFLSNNAEADAQTLSIGESLEEQQLAILATESLRRMRGLPGKLDDKFIVRWAHSLQSPQSDWQPFRGGNSGEAMDSPMAVAELFRRVARLNRSSCVVNWLDARRRRLSPEQLMMSYTGDDAGQMLSLALAPFEMQVRQVDANHWWIGTEATYDRLLILVWSEPLGTKRESFSKSVEALLSAAKPENFLMSYDETSDRLMMLLPRFLAKQIPKLAD